MVKLSGVNILKKKKKQNRKEHFPANKLRGADALVKTAKDIASYSV